MRPLILTVLLLVPSFSFAIYSGPVPNDQMPIFSCKAMVSGYFTGRRQIEVNLVRYPEASGAINVELRISGKSSSFYPVETGRIDKERTQKNLSNILRLFGPSGLLELEGLVPAQIASTTESLIYQFGNSESSEEWGYLQVFMNKDGTPEGASLTLHEGEMISTGACVPVIDFGY